MHIFGICAHQNCLCHMKYAETLDFETVTSEMEAEPVTDEAQGIFAFWLH